MDYDPALTRHKLSTLLRRDLDGRYEVFIGGRLQGGNVIVGYNDWVGAMVNIRQQESGHRTSLDIRPTVPSGARFIAFAAVIMLGALCAYILLEKGIAPLLAISVLLLTVLLALLYFHVKSREVTTAVVSYLMSGGINDDAPRGRR
ncbi:MAG: hypothetical protein C4534_10745 [Gaiellales bacterium]|nr:MAG: hypothetical protein C4534_10745 [Gaiellales bacterium]